MLFDSKGNIYGHGSMTIERPEDFNADHIFNCGQTFRFRRFVDHIIGTIVWVGIVDEHLVAIKTLNGNIDIFFSGLDPMYWFDFFDIGTCYSQVKNLICDFDSRIAPAVDYGHGIRILHQDPWEVLISFLISQCNNIPRIQTSIERLSVLGRKIQFPRDCQKAFFRFLDFRDFVSFREVYNMLQNTYTFPTPLEIVNREAMLKNIGLGFRQKYIFNMSQVFLKEQIDFGLIENMPTKEARKYLECFYGVGPKIANCVLLFGFGRYDACPIDTWIPRILNSVFDIKPSNADIFMAQTFGEYSGFAQQYLYYYRHKLIKNNIL